MMVFNEKCGDVGSFAVRSECEEGGKEFSLHFLYKTLWSMEIYRGCARTAGGRGVSRNMD